MFPKKKEKNVPDKDFNQVKMSIEKKKKLGMVSLH